MSNTASKCATDAEPLQHRVGMVGRAVGQDQLASGQFCDRRAHRRIGLQRRMIDLVHIGEIVVGAHAVLGHHAAHGGAVAAVIVLLDHARFLRRNLQIVRDELADPRIDLLPQIDVMRIQRVVEIEHPGVDVGEGGVCSVCFLITASQIAASCRRRSCRRVAQSRSRRGRGVPQSPCSLISNLLSRVQSCVAPPQFSGLSLNLSARLSASTASAKLKICFGWPVTSGCRHLPGSMRYQPRLVTALPSSVPTAAMILCGVSLHQVSPVDDGDCTASIMVVEEVRRLHDVGGQPAALQERRQCGLRLRAVDAVDRRRVIARDHQQPLDAGEPRLLVVIFAAFGEIGHQIAVVGPASA